MMFDFVEGPDVAPGWVCDIADDCERVVEVLWSEPDGRFTSGAVTMVSCKAHDPRATIAKAEGKA